MTGERVESLESFAQVKVLSFARVVSSELFIHVGQVERTWEQPFNISLRSKEMKTYLRFIVTASVALSLLVHDLSIDCGIYFGPLVESLLEAGVSFDLGVVTSDLHSEDGRSTARTIREHHNILTAKVQAVVTDQREKSVVKRTRVDVAESLRKLKRNLTLVNPISSEVL